jgi:hypothetical protein
VTDRVKKYFGAESEKAIQYKFATNDPYVIDTEFQLGNDLRIDLVRLDASVKKIVFIEVKTMGDPRLFTPTTAGKENIHDQLKKYNDFAVQHANDIAVYYTKVLQVKIDLGLFKDSKLSLAGWQVEPRPLLLFGDCEQSWIDQNSAGIDKKIKGVAYGAYYFGAPDYSLDLIPKSNKNRHVY